MSALTGSIKGLLQIKFKTRHDSYTDQFNRIFMVKMMLICSMILGFNWFKDSITCIVPGSAGIDKKFVEQACWIQGLYIFKDMGMRSTNPVAYYGIASNFVEDGKFPDGNLCSVFDRSNNPTKNCRPMEKTFYLQYQWFPFYVAILGFVFYAPYLLFRVVNTDLISLKGTIKSPTVTATSIGSTYFNHQINTQTRMNIRVMLNLLIKLFYLASNVVAFVVTDALVNGDFRKYGLKWLSWSKMSNEDAYMYATYRTNPKPGDVLLPPFGICEVIELNKDVKYTLLNKYKFVCEISQHVLYQYVLIVMWYLFIIGICISILGFVMRVVDHVITVTCFLTQGQDAKRVYQTLSLRECEYLEFIRRKNMPVYAELIRKIKSDRIDGSQPNGSYRANGDHPYAESQKLLKEAINL